MARPYYYFQRPIACMPAATRLKFFTPSYFFRNSPPCKSCTDSSGKNLQRRFCLSPLRKMSLNVVKFQCVPNRIPRGLIGEQLYLVSNRLENFSASRFHGFSFASKIKITGHLHFSKTLRSTRKAITCMRRCTPGMCVDKE